jgi:hypothetical protein
MQFCDGPDKGTGWNFVQLSEKVWLDTKLVFEQMAAQVLEIMDGSLYHTSSLPLIIPQNMQHT